MDLIHESVTNVDHIHVFNHVRLALKLLTASDIVAVANGARVLDSIKNCKNHRKSTMCWPHSEKIPPSWKKIWSMLITNIVEPAIQRRPLGDWIKCSHQTWDWKTDETQSIISNSTMTYQRMRTTRYSTYTLIDTYHEATISCDVNILNKTKIQYVSAGSTKATQERPHVQQTPVQRFHAITDSRARNWGNVVLTKRILRKTKKLLTKNNVAACSDGSINHGRAAHAWGLATKKNKKLFLSGSAPVDGIPSVLNSTRAEILGIIACVTFLHWVSEEFGIKNKTITIYTDSEASIECSKMKNLHSTKYAFHTDIDVILELQKALKTSSHKIILEHVEGHQDRHTPYDDLTPEAKLNVKMDRAVGRFIDDNPDPFKHTYNAPHFPTQRVCFSCNGCTVTGNMRETLIDSFNEPARNDYMKNISVKRAAQE